MKLIVYAYYYGLILTGQPHPRPVDRPRIQRFECVRIESYKVGPCESFGYPGGLSLLSFLSFHTVCPLWLCPLFTLSRSVLLNVSSRTRTRPFFSPSDIRDHP